MRTIKFRAWESGKMYYQVRCGGFFDGIPTAPTTWSEDAKGWVNLTGEPYTIVMQYSGLNDRNGTDIYEGDILRVIEVRDEDMREYVTDVIFEECAFVLKSGGSDYDTFLAAWASDPNNTYPLFELEVIGNIYENPELLSEVTE